MVRLPLDTMSHDSKRILVTAVALLIAAVTASARSRANRLRGTWGSDQAVLEVHDHYADLTVPCGVGHIDGRIVLDRKGRFRIAGTFTHLRGVRPAPDTPPAASEPVHFRGRVIGDTLELSVEFSDRNQTNIYILKRGVAAQVPLCA